MPFKLSLRLQPLGLLLTFALFTLCMRVNAAEHAVILQYHHIADDTPASTSTGVALFQSHLAYFDDNGYQVVSLDSVVKVLQQGGTLPERALVITFDDGYRSVCETAFPLLQARNMPFTVFVNAEPHDQGLPSHCSWEQLQAMRGLATFANHSYSHQHLVELSRAEVEADLSRNQQRLQEKLGDVPPWLAYPFGEYNQAILDLLEDWGWIGLGQHSGAVGAYSNLRALPRFPASNAYAGLEQLPTKLQSLPLPITDVTPLDPTEMAANPPLLRFTLADGLGPGRLTCFGSQQGAIAVAAEGQRITVVGNQPFNSRRFRYNCTLPAGEGRFYWHSAPWIQPQIPE